MDKLKICNRILIILTVLTIFFIAACEKTDASITSNGTKTAVSSTVEQNEDIEANTEETTVNKNKPVKFEKTIWSFDEEKIAKAVELGFPSPFETYEKTSQTPSNKDVINFDVNASGESFFSSITHKGFTGLEITYNRHQYQWNDFFGELDYTDYDRNITVNLKDESIYEADIVDDFEKYYRYYYENEGIYYEVTEMMMGNYTDKPENLTKNVLGKSCYYKGIDGLIEPTYNPFILEKEEVINDCYITSLDSVPVIYLESTYNDRLYKKWISPQYGVTLKELIFDSEGLIVDSKIVTNIVEKSIDDSVFFKPNNVDYNDITLFIYSFEGGNIEPLKEALVNTLPEQNFSMVLKNSLGDELILHAGGYDGDQALDTPVIISKATDLNGAEITLRSYFDGNYYITICDEKKIVEKYASSCFEMKFFDFKRTGFIGVKEDDDSIIYTFKNMCKGSVSGFLEFYEYEVDKNTNSISKISAYHKEELNSDKICGDVIEYEILEFGEADESLFDIPNNYKIIDHGENSHNDGEHMPPWYE